MTARALTCAVGYVAGYLAGVTLARILNAWNLRVCGLTEWSRRNA